MTMTFIRRIKLVISCVVVSVHISTITAATKSWTKSEFPNPQIDVDDCGNNGKKSWVCDPARLLKREDVDALNEMIIQLRGEYSCQGWVAAVAVVPRIRLTDNVYPSTYDERLDATREFADYLRNTSWKFGACDNDLVIVASAYDQTASANTASGMRKKLSEDCLVSIADIYDPVKSVTHQYDLAESLKNLMRECLNAKTTASTIDPDTWHRYDFPNPQLDVDTCGNNGKKSSVCDPARLLTRKEVDALNKQILQLNPSGSCEDWTAAIAVVPKRIRDNACPWNKSIDGEELSMTRTFADYLRTNSWTFGNCSTDLVIVISDKDKTVWTSTSNRAHGGLPEDCVDDIYEEEKHYFTEQNYAKGLSYLLEQYRRVLLTEERKCKGSSWDARVVGGSSAGVTLLIFIIIVVVYWTDGCGLCRER